MSEQIDFIDAARDAAIEWARATLANPDAVILDTETTGLGDRDQIVQIAVLGMDGRELLNELVNPTVEISEGTYQVHGISKALVQDKPTFDQIFPRLVEATQRRTVIIYNADYDVRLIRQSNQPFPVAYKSMAEWFPAYECAMLNYSQFCGEWNDYRGNFRWQRLPGGDHSAMGDCKATLEVIKRMAEQKLTSEKEEELHA